MWLANMIMVKDTNGKRRMYTNYTDINKGCPNDTYHLLDIDQIVENPKSYELPSFLEAYLGYNQIIMYPSNEDNPTFMTEGANFCYKVILFLLKNVSAIYQFLVERVFRKLMGDIIEVYFDDIVVKYKGPSYPFWREFIIVF